MKRIFGFILVVIVLFSLNSCYSTNYRRSGKVPPGQAKKIFGGKSAKRYAPGQQKKKNKKNNNNRKYDVYLY